MLSSWASESSGVANFTISTLSNWVLANDASRVAAGRASLFAEARRARGVPLRQIGSIEHFARMQVGKHDFSGGDKEVVAGNVIRVVFELGKLARAEHGLTLHDDRRPPFFETAGRVRIEEIVDERALTTSACAAEHRETAARKAYCLDRNRGCPNRCQDPNGA